MQNTGGQKETWSTTQMGSNHAIFDLNPMFIGPNHTLWFGSKNKRLKVSLIILLKPHSHIQKPIFSQIFKSRSISGQPGAARKSSLLFHSCLSIIFCPSNSFLLPSLFHSPNPKRKSCSHKNSQLLFPKSYPCEINVSFFLFVREIQQ